MNVLALLGALVALFVMFGLALTAGTPRTRGRRAYWRRIAVTFAMIPLAVVLLHLGGAW